MNFSINRDLIFDHFANKTTTLQKRLIEEWLRDEANQEQFYQWLVEWEQQFPSYQPQIEAPLQQFIEHMDVSPLSVRSSDPEPIEAGLTLNNWNGWRRLVACAVLLLGVTFWLLREQFIYNTYQTDFGQIRTVRLDDGTTVKLNANSSLRVPRWGFGSKDREVLLKGEASFSVTHTLDHLPFIVRTARQLDVVVLGTEFTLTARQYKTRVVLKKGKVQLRYLEHEVPKQVVMKPGDLVTLDRSNHAELKTAVQVENYSAWEARRFVFDEMTLEEVADQLEESYGLEVEIKGKELPGRVLMGSFRAGNLDELLQTLSELLDINVVREGNKVQMMEKEQN